MQVRPPISYCGFRVTICQEEDFGDFEASQSPSSYVPFVHMFPTHGLGWAGVGLSLISTIGEEAKVFVERHTLNGSGAANLSLTGWLSVARYDN